MRFPLSLTRSMAGHLLRQRLAGRKRFPLVLMLEPLHACNLTCTGCGRIREYSTSLKARLSIDQCLAAVEECGAPVVSICGGEPLIYPGIEELVGRITDRGHHVYLCTNGTALAKKLPGFRPSSRLSINIHLDGMEATHDAIVERQGVFAKAIEGLKAAKAAGFCVCTNTTVYRETDMHEVAVLFEYLTELGVDGLLISPAYGYTAVRETNPSGADAIFMSREEVEAKFRSARDRLRPYRLASTPLYLDFLAGLRELSCAAWANPTRNIRGWKGPCYLITDAHYDSYRELVEATDWDSLGPGNDERCADCKVHCGFEPAAVLKAQASVREMLRMAVWQMK